MKYSKSPMHSKTGTGRGSPLGLTKNNTVTRVRADSASSSGSDPARRMDSLQITVKQSEPSAKKGGLLSPVKQSKLKAPVTPNKSTGKKKVQI